MKPHENFQNRDATSKFQLKPPYSCINPSHMPCHTVSTTLLHTCSISPLFLPLDSCISITGHLTLFFHTLFMKCRMNILKYYEFLGDSVILQNLSLKYLPISISVWTACLKLPPNSPLEFMHSLYPCSSQDRYLLSFLSQIHRNCSEIFLCVSS